MNILDAVYEVLKVTKRPMKVSELLAEITSRGLWQTNGETPKDSVGASLYEDIKKMGAKSRFAKVGHGYFTLAIASRRGSRTSNEGYVYILKHPCFLPNIVKIGKTQGAVEDRAKQLFTTALPREFEIYATLKTSKFAETEELIHEFFKDKRISPKREFFSISPEEALEVFYKVKRLLSDGEITEDFKKRKPFEDEEPTKKDDKVLSSRQKIFLSFWTEFYKYAKKDPAFMAEFSLRKPGKYCYYDLAIKHTSYHVFLRITSKKGTILSGIYVSKNKPTYEKFLAQREAIERFLKSKVDWSWATQDGAFALVKEFDINGSQKLWREAFKWLCEKAVLFKRVDEKFGGQ